MKNIQTVKKRKRKGWRDREREKEMVRERREKDGGTERRNIIQHDNTKKLDIAQHHAVAWCVPI